MSDLLRVPILIVKGQAGFGNRLYTLSHALLQRQQRPETAICVDWSDPAFGDGTCGFGDYLALSGIPTCSLDDVLAVAGSRSLWPSFWTKDNLRETIHEVNRRETLTELDPDLLVPENIIVYTHRYPAVRDLLLMWKHLRYTGPIEQEWRQRSREVRKPYWAVHMRARDRPCQTPEQHAELIREALRSSGYNPATLFVATDDASTVPRLAELLPEMPIVSFARKLNCPDDRGIHFLREARLQRDGLTKRMLCEDVICDFQLCVAADRFFPSHRSTFSANIADLRRIRQSQTCP